MPLDAGLAFSTIAEIGKLYRRRKLSPIELTRFLLDRIARLNPRLNAYLALNSETALKDAAAAEAALCTKSRRKSTGDLGPLHGIPISLKDNLYTAGLRTTGGSGFLRDFLPLQNAAVVASLKNAGTVLLGKTNLHEFAYGVTSNNPHFGPVRNPWDLDRIPGGSSGGSAAALAAGLCYGSIGTDTGGSIRIPASLCGIVGLKPGLGRVSAEGAIPLSPTLDFVGPMARTVADTALLFDTIPIPDGVKRRPRAARGQQFRLGIPKHFFLDIVSPEIQHAFESSLVTLKKLGAKLKEVSLPYLKETEQAGNQIAWAEATHYHQQAGWYPLHAAEYGEDVRSRLEMGEKVSALDYLRALDLREKFIAGFHLTLLENEVDALVTPTTPIAAPLIGEETISIAGKDHSTRALLLRLNRPANLGGIPAISVPCGLTPAGLPAGLQFATSVHGESLLLELAARFEQSHPLNAHPDLTSLE
ncbi:MAG TPA: amidase [Candidatus Sulfotelmatobacter sp.]|jgi:aspartyl-tRNA(Asn)/glutamyl-tRNA(Gln) amidotransferase subunit A|nr:amidase [Candidatus Sulfotelmatobacter sp.]